MSEVLLLNISDTNDHWNKMALQESRKEADLQPRKSTKLKANKQSTTEQATRVHSGK